MLAFAHGLWDGAALGAAVCPACLRDLGDVLGPRGPFTRSQARDLSKATCQRVESQPVPLPLPACVRGDKAVTAGVP